MTEGSRMKIAVNLHGRGRRLWLDNYYQDLTYAELVKLAVETLDAVSNGDAKKIWKARKP